MHIVVMASQKGGAGKTTLACHLAVQAELLGDGPAYLIDADPQGTLAEWWNARRHSDVPQLAQIDQHGLDAALVALDNRGAQLVIIDTPGRIDDAIGRIIARADLVIIPVVPSPNDLRAIGRTIESVEGAGVPLMFVVNNSGDKLLTTQTYAKLSEYGTVAPAEAICRTRQDYRASMFSGQTVMEFAPGGNSAAEIAALWTYVKSRLQKGRGRGKAID